MKVIGLVGEKGGGKGAFVEILKELDGNIAHLRSSDLLLETPASLGIPKEKVSRKQLQDLAVALEKLFGRGCISRGMRCKIEKQTAPIIVFDGIRWPSDVDAIRDFPHHLLIYVTAKPRARFERALKRNEKAGERTMTYARFLKEEKAKTERFIRRIGKKADIIIVNNGSRAELRNEVRLVYQQQIQSAE